MCLIYLSVEADEPPRSGPFAGVSGTVTIPSFVIGIVGGSGAGKTTVARSVTESVGESVTWILIDNYYKDQSHLDMAEREQVNYDHPSVFEWDLLYEQLSELMEGWAVEMPQCDFRIHNRKSECETVEPTDVIILGGILVLYDESVNEMLDPRLYVETGADVRILRRTQRGAIDRGRDLQGVIDQYPSTVKPVHERFTEPTKKRAGLIILEGANSVVVTLFEEKVQAEVEGDEARTWERDVIEREVQERASPRGSGN